MFLAFTPIFSMLLVIEAFTLLTFHTEFMVQGLGFRFRVEV
jgi:hypothetical protein